MSSNKKCGFHYKLVVFSMVFVALIFNAVTLGFELGKFVH